MDKNGVKKARKVQNKGKILHFAIRTRRKKLWFEIRKVRWTGINLVHYKSHICGAAMQLPQNAHSHCKTVITASSSIHIFIHTYIGHYHSFLQLMQFSPLQRSLFSVDSLRMSDLCTVQYSMCMLCLSTHACLYTNADACIKSQRSVYTKNTGRRTNRT